MTQQIIGVGTTANDGTGDTLRAAFQKANDNFTELYAGSGAAPNVSVAAVVPQGFTGSVLVAQGMGVPTTIGTLTTGSVAATNERTRRRRVTAYTGAAANTSAGLRSPVNGYAVGYRGDQAGRGGFSAKFRFALNLVPSGYRLFVGLIADAAAPTATNDPSAYVSCVGLGKDAGDATFSLMCNDSTGTASKTAIPTGNIPVSADTVIELTLACARGNGQPITYEVKTITGVDGAGNDAYGTPVTGSLTADIPATLTPLYPLFLINTGAGTSDCRLDVLKFLGVTYGD